MSEFPIYSIPIYEEINRLNNVDGVVKKGWINIENLGRCLLKLGDNSFNEVWKEKIASELAQQIGIPTASYEFAELPDGRKAILSPNYMKPNWIEKVGRECLQDNSKNLYTLENVIDTIDISNLTLPNIALPTNIDTSSDLFTGYLLVDYWIANGDRHGRNWGIQIDPLSGQKELLPLFDCGFSMRFANSRNRGAEYLRWYTDDLEIAFVSETNFPIQMRELIKKLQQLKPEATRSWIERLENIDRDSVIQLFDRIPNGWIQASQIAPAIDLITYNRDRLIELNRRPSDT